MKRFTSTVVIVVGYLFVAISIISQHSVLSEEGRSPPLTRRQTSDEKETHAHADMAAAMAAAAAAAAAQLEDLQEECEASKDGHGSIDKDYDRSTRSVGKSTPENQEKKNDHVNQEAKKESQLDTAQELPLSTTTVDPFLGRQHLLLVPRDSPDRLLLTKEITEKMKSLQSMSFPTDWEYAEGKEFAHLQNRLMRHVLSDEKIHATTVPLELRSHPGMAIVPLYPDLTARSYMMLGLKNYTELGIGPVKQALDISVAERTIFQRDVDGALMALGSGIVEVGSPVLLTSGNKDDISLKISHFIVHDDGSISPKEAPHLVIGIFSLPKVTLVPRDSSHRFIFEKSKDLALSAKRALGSSEGVDLILKSHPNLAVVQAMEPYNQENIMRVMELGVGPKENALRLSFEDVGYETSENQILLLKRPTDGFVLLPFDRRLFAGNRMIMTKYEVDSFLITAMIANDCMLTFTLNEEGSISPRNAPHLTLGSTNLAGHVDHIITKEQRMIATQRAQLDSTAPPFDEWDGYVLLLIAAHNALGVKHEVILWSLGLFGSLLALALIAIIQVIPWNACLVLLGCMCFGYVLLLTAAHNVLGGNHEVILWSLGLLGSLIALALIAIIKVVPWIAWLVLLGWMCYGVRGVIDCYLYWNCLTLCVQGVRWLWRRCTRYNQDPDIVVQ